MKSIDGSNKSKRGRPPVDSEPVNLRLPRDILTALEAYRRQQEAIPTRPEAIRSILAEWLKAKGFLK